MADRSVQDTRQTLYAAHNRTNHCGCKKCLDLRAVMPRVAAQIDGECETARRAVQYRSGDLS